MANISGSVRRVGPRHCAGLDLFLYVPDPQSGPSQWSVAGCAGSQNGIPPQSGEWGSTRILYLQYATDGIVFFSPSLIWQRPEWLDQPRGPGVSPRLRWVPIVTFLQVGFDLLTATTTPSGQGHVYAGVDYMTGWNAMLGTDRSPEELARLKFAMAERDL